MNQLLWNWDGTEREWNVMEWTLVRLVPIF
ncbi:MAG: hypothetical protein ACI90V_010481 [Bacillariaceae sp.]|jgi:hypothetical protein